MDRPITRSMTAAYRAKLTIPSRPTAPIKMDFSKMRQKPVSEGFVFPKSTEQQLAEALAKIAELKEQISDAYIIVQKEVKESEMLKKQLAEKNISISKMQKEKDDYIKKMSLSLTPTNYVVYSNTMCLYKEDDCTRSYINPSTKLPWTDQEIADEAKKVGCKIAMRRPTGQWYLKGRDHTYNRIENELSVNVNDTRWEGRHIILVK